MSLFAYEKWEATGNDFVVVDLASSRLSHCDFSPELAVRICDRKTGVGADGLVLLNQGASTVEMTIINSDGSSSGMCGNALRCVAQILHRTGGSGSHLVAIGDRVVECQVDSSGVACVVMGQPSGVGHLPLLSSTPEFDARLGRGYLVWFGNPHVVAPVSEIPENWSDQGRDLQDLADGVLGMGGINCGFLQSGEPSDKDGSFRLRVFERGAGVTQSCGSGACAASAVLEKVFNVEPPHRLELLGGVVTVGRSPDGFILSGPARLEFKGEWSES